jgi:hypothetical protein
MTIKIKNMQEMEDIYKKANKKYQEDPEFRKKVSHVMRELHGISCCKEKENK